MRKEKDQQIMIQMVDQIKMISTIKEMDKLVWEIIVIKSKLIRIEDRIII
jgi:hypothetical protein